MAKKRKRKRAKKPEGLPALETPTEMTINGESRLMSVAEAEKLTGFTQQTATEPAKEATPECNEVQMSEPSGEAEPGGGNRPVTSARPEPRENFLQSRLERTVLDAIRNSGDKGITDPGLDYIFGKRVLSPQREKIFSRFQILNLARCEATPGGGRIWFPVLRRSPAKNETIKQTVEPIVELEPSEAKEENANE